MPGYCRGSWLSTLKEQGFAGRGNSVARAMVDLGKCKELSTPKHLPLLAMGYGSGEVTGAPVVMSLVCQAKKSELHLEGVGVWVCNLNEF